MDRYANEDAQSDITEASVASHQTSMTLRNARMNIQGDRTTDALTKQILGEVEEAIPNRDDAEQEDKTTALTMVNKIFTYAKYALDIAYSAGVLASDAQGYAREDSLKYAASIPNGQLERLLGKARKRLDQTSTQIDEFLNTKYRDAKGAL